MFDPKKPVQTRSGRPARILATDSRVTFGGNEQPIIAEYIHNYDGGWVIGSFSPEGKFVSDDSEFDLVNIPETQTFWANIYADAGKSPYVGLIKQDKQAVLELGDLRSKGLLEFRITGDKIETIFHPKEQK